jgi:titin
VQVLEYPGGAKKYVHESAVAVRYSREGFPDFSPFKYAGKEGKAEVLIGPTGKQSADIAAANKAAGFKRTPTGFTWHHHEEVGRMILVDEKVHYDFAHTGGFAIWKQIQKVKGGQ